MGGMAYMTRRGKELTLNQIMNEGYKILVRLVGEREETQEPAMGAYKLFKELDEKAIRDYATATAKENKVRLINIQVWSLESKLLKELQP